MLQTVEVIVRDLPKDYSNMWSALLGALVGGLITATVSYFTTKASLRNSRELREYERKLEFYNRYYSFLNNSSIEIDEDDQVEIRLIKEEEFIKFLNDNFVHLDLEAQEILTDINNLIFEYQAFKEDDLIEDNEYIAKLIKYVNQLKLKIDIEYKSIQNTRS